SSSAREYSSAPQPAAMAKADTDLSDDDSTAVRTARASNEPVTNGSFLSFSTTVSGGAGTGATTWPMPGTVLETAKADSYEDFKKRELAQGRRGEPPSGTSANGAATDFSITASYRPRVPSMQIVLPASN